MAFDLIKNLFNFDNKIEKIEFFSKNVTQVVNHVQENNIRQTFFIFQKQAKNNEKLTSPSEDWWLRFIEGIKFASKQEAREVWACILRQEGRKPGSISFQTMEVLKSLDAETARLFETLCSMCFVASQKDNPLNAVVPCFSGHPGKDALKEYGLSFNGLSRLSDHNLIMLEYSSVAAWDSWDDLILPIMDCRQQISVTTTFFQFQGKKWMLRATQQYEGNFRFRISGITLKSAGQELLSVMNVQQDDKFVEYVKTNLLSEGIEMVEVEE